MKKNLLALLIGLVLALGFFVAANFLGAIAHSHTAYLIQKGFLDFHKNEWAQVLEDPTYFKREIKVGPITTHFDKKMRRLTGAEDKVGSRFAAFFGCSFIFGDGVEDNETLAAHFHQQNPDYVSYNYGVTGGGAHTSLYRVMNRPFEEEVSLDQGVVFYGLLWGHIGRANYSLDSAFFSYPFPRFEVVNDTVVYRGSQIDASPILGRLWKALATMHFINFNSHHLVGEDTHEAIQKYAAIVAELKRVILEVKPKTRFIAMVYPGEAEHPKAMKALEEKGIEVWDYSKLEYPDDVETKSDDFHPTSEMNRHLANVLHARLSKTEKPFGK